MAYEILLYGDKRPHRATHDLESLFYVLIWVCTMYEGPNNQERSFKKNLLPPLSSWGEPQFGGAPGNGDIKFGQCGQFEFFEQRILKFFAPYFHDLKQCCIDLRDLFFGEMKNRQDVRHDAMRAILQKTLDGLVQEPRTTIIRGLKGISVPSRSGRPSTVEEEMEDDDELMTSDEETGDETDDDSVEEDEDAIDDGSEREPDVADASGAFGFGPCPSRNYAYSQ